MIEEIEQLLITSDKEDKSLQDCLITLLDYYKNQSDVFSASEHFSYILAQIEKYIILYNMDRHRVDRVIKYREYLLQYFKLFDIKI